MAHLCHPHYVQKKVADQLQRRQPCTVMHHPHQGSIPSVVGSGTMHRAVAPPLPLPQQAVCWARVPQPLARMPQPLNQLQKTLQIVLLHFVRGHCSVHGMLVSTR
jgi:hypothetical protein